MATQTGQVTVRGGFVKGKVLLVPGGDFFQPGQVRNAVKAANYDGESATFDGLPVGARYFVVQRPKGEDTFRQRAVTAKVPPAAAVKPSPAEVQSRLVATRPSDAGATRAVIEGARSSGHALLEGESDATRDDRKRQDAPSPLHAAGTLNEPLVSDTPLGAAIPATADDEQPRPRVEDAKRGAELASATETGSLEPAAVKERQEDVTGVEQLSDTPHGEATRTSVIEAKLARGSSSVQEPIGEAATAAPTPKKVAAKRKPRPAAKRKAAQKPSDVKKPAAKRSRAKRS